MSDVTQKQIEFDDVPMVEYKFETRNKTTGTSVSYRYQIDGVHFHFPNPAEAAAYSKNANKSQDN